MGDDSNETWTNIILKSRLSKAFTVNSPMAASEGNGISKSKTCFTFSDNFSITCKPMKQDF